jgi:PAS domain S-box-containing protein
MTDRSIGNEREESIIDLWFFIIVSTTILALLIDALGFYYHTGDVASLLFFIPIVIAAYWYPRQAILFSVFLSGLYLAMTWYFSYGGMADVTAALVKCIVLVGIAAVVSSLAAHMRRSEVRYRSIFDQSESGVGLIELRDLSIREVNKRFASILGYSRDELPGVRFADLWIDTMQRENFLNALNKTGSVENFETRFHSKIKGPRWILISAGRIFDNQVVCTIVDITERKRAEEALLIRDYAISSSINPIAILDHSYGITYANASFTKMTGYPVEREFYGKNFGSVIISSEPAFAELKLALEQGGNWSGEVELKRFDSSPFYVLLWANLVKDKAGNPVCILISFIDISESKQTEMVKRRALEQIEKNIEQFTILNDRIRNPLAVIVGLSSLAPGEITDKILHQAQEIDKIVTLLDRGWIESDNVREFIKKYYKTDEPVSVRKGNRRNEKKW